MSRRTLTHAVIFGVTGALIAYDVWAAFTPGGTVSEVMLALAHRHPVIPFAFGMLCGHFFWSQAAEAEWTGPLAAGAAPPAGWRWGVVLRPRLPLYLGLGVLALGLLLAWLR